MAGLTFEGVAKGRPLPKDSIQQPTPPASPPRQQFSDGSTGPSLRACLTDPVVQGLDFTSRMYLSYFASDVCQDLVLYDTQQNNPFRNLIPMAHRHPILLHTIIANSALRMSNARQKSLLKSSTLPATQHVESYKHALAAKQQALHMLQSTISNVAAQDFDTTLAVVLLCIEFELIDSGRNKWTYHVDGAKRLIMSLFESNVPTKTKTPMSPLRKFLISNCLVFDVLGSTLACSIRSAPANGISMDGLSLLQDIEGNHCSSFPPALLQLVQEGAHLSQLAHQSLTRPMQQQQAALLLNQAQSFDAEAWATRIQLHSPATDFLPRMHIASAHRAAVCIYLTRVLLSLSTHSEPSDDLEILVEDTLYHLSQIDATSPLFKATPWAAFVAGVETNDPAKREWVARRFLELWEFEPWGNIREALGVLEMIWSEKRMELVGKDKGICIHGRKGDRNWIRGLRGKGADWLII